MRVCTIFSSEFRIIVELTVQIHNSGIDTNQAVDSLTVLPLCAVHHNIDGGGFGRAGGVHDLAAAFY